MSFARSLAVSEKRREADGLDLPCLEFCKEGSSLALKWRGERLCGAGRAKQIEVWSIEPKRRDWVTRGGENFETRIG